MPNPEQEAFRSRPEKVNENLQQADATSNLQDEVNKTRASEAKVETVKVAETSDAGMESPGAALMKSLARIQELASRLPSHILDEFVDNQKKHLAAGDSKDTYANQVLVSAIDTRDPETRDKVLGAILKAQGIVA